MIDQIDHIALAVHDIDEAVSLYEAVFGLRCRSRELNESDRFEVAIFEIGESTIELLAPTSPDSIIGRFIAKRGPGIHHIALRVRDTDAALNHCEAAGIQLLDSTSRRGTDGTKIGFLGPKSTMGTLIELVEVADRE